MLNRKIGQSYNIPGNNEITNLEILNHLCILLDQMMPSKESYVDQIQFVQDRPGHDRRYALDDGKLQRELGWKPQVSLMSGLKLTIKWYLKNQIWIKNALEHKTNGL